MLLARLSRPAAGVQPQPAFNWRILTERDELVRVETLPQHEHAYALEALLRRGFDAAGLREERMDETRRKLLASARGAFSEKGLADTSMVDLTAAVGLARGALCHNFGDKKGLFAAFVDQINAEMAHRAHATAASENSLWPALLAEGCACIEMALDPECSALCCATARGSARSGPLVKPEPLPRCVTGGGRAVAGRWGAAGGEP